MKSKTQKNKRFGIYYKSHGKWIGPFSGKTYTMTSLNREPLKSAIPWLKNYGLKSKISIRPVN